MKTQHTPGPWQCGFLHAGSEDPNEAHFWLRSNDREISKLTEIESNARLIAAAPDLLAALDGVMDLLDRAASNASGNLEHFTVSPLVAAAHAAVAKARGEA